MTIRLGAVRNLISQVKKLDSDSLMKKVFGVSALQQDILDLNREDQLYEKGIMADGQPLPPYHPKTISYKIKMGQRHDHMTLNDKGKFYSTFKFKNEQQDFIISADTIKKGEANADYGKIIQLSNGKHVISSVVGTPDSDLMDYGEILGLTQEDKGVVCGWIRAPFINQMKSAIWK